MEPNHGHDKQRERMKYSEGVGRGMQLERWESLTERFKWDQVKRRMGIVPYLLRLLVKVEELEIL